MTTPSPFPNIPGNPPPAPAQGPPGQSSLLGGTSVPKPAGPTPDQRTAGYMDQIRNIHLQIDALANQYPAASDELGQAKVALANSMAKVAAAMAQPEQSPGPQTF